ncbi:hypothetical protein Ahy_A09g044035 [Arachis hypogaea]|uniref:Uncharacterized protein n=1 Tax=Arachis hypogaea TaxID=3818 RepID=A0A445BJG3_ARAHY|nr:hypothetical protein Ahy_A09g044035 [Arachis hypogaea]
MHVTHCDRRASVFVVDELEPFKCWSQGSFRVHLAGGTCDYGLFQSLCFPCRYALAACAVASIEWGSYVHPVYRQQSVFRHTKKLSEIIDGDHLGNDADGRCHLVEPAPISEICSDVGLPKAVGDTRVPVTNHAYVMGLDGMGQHNYQSKKPVDTEDDKAEEEVV